MSHATDWKLKQSYLKGLELSYIPDPVWNLIIIKYFEFEWLVDGCIHNLEVPSGYCIVKTFRKTKTSGSGHTAMLPDTVIPLQLLL